MGSAKPSMALFSKMAAIPPAPPPFLGGRCRGRGPTAAFCSGPEAAERLTSRVRAPSPDSPLPATLPPNRHNLTLPSKQGQHPSCCCLPGAPQSRAEQAWPGLAALPPPPRKLQLLHSERFSKGFWTFHPSSFSYRPASLLGPTEASKDFPPSPLQRPIWSGLQRPCHVRMGFG